MSKKFTTIIVLSILLVILWNGFSNSYTSRNIGNLAYVLALGIDKGEKAKMKISAQFMKSAAFSPGSESSSENAKNMVLVSGEANSIFSGLNLLNSYIGKELNLAHCSVIIFSEEFAKEGIASEVYSLINNEEVQLISNLVISKCSAYDYLDNSNPNLEEMTVKYYDTFSITSRFTGYISNITIGDFYNTFSEQGCSSTAILGGLNSTARQEDSQKSSSQSSQEQNYVIINPEDLTAGTSSVVGKRGTENIGIAVLKNGSFCGELTAIESICHLLITNKVDSCVLTIDSPIISNKKMEIQLFPNKKTNIFVDIKKDKIYISVKLDLNADILSLAEHSNYESKENLDKVSKSAEDYLNNQFKNYFNKISKEYGSDIDCFCMKAYKYFSTIPEWESFNWTEKFKDAEFNTDINVNVTSSLLLTET